MRRWDMHVHTNWSDGSVDVNDVVRFAAAEGLSGIAITDHDAVDMILPAKEQAARNGIEIIDGIELSTMDKDTGRKVHILVYYPRNIEALQPHIKAINERRYAAGEKMIEILKNRFPISREQVENYSSRSKTIYRTHIMQALMDMGYSEQVYGELYNELFGKNGSCLCKVIYTETIAAAKMARESGGVVILAHPGVYNSFEIGEKLASMGLIDGIENSYPRKKAQDEAKHQYLIEKYKLLTSGGTDYHGFYSSDPKPLGTCFALQNEVLAIKELSDKRR